MQIRKSQKIGAHKIQQKLLKNGINIPKPNLESWIYDRTKVTAK